MITNNYYYGNNQNMNTGKFNGDNSQYNFTNQKPVPINQIKQKQRVYNSKPKTSSNIYRPINPQELQEARNALASLKMKMQQKQNHPPVGNKNLPRSNTTNIQIKQRPITRQEPQQNRIRQVQNFNQNIEYNNEFNNLPKTTIGGNKPILYEDNTYNNVMGREDINPNDDRPLDKKEYKQNMEDEQPEVNNPEPGEPTYPCPDCGRKFVRAVYDKHVKICKKVFMKKRKAFDSKEARKKESALEEFEKEKEMETKYNGSRKKNTKQKEQPIKKSDVPKWKKQSEELRNIDKATAEATMTGKGPQIVMPIPSSYDDDLILCKYCNRKYNEEAYNKHAPGCERRFKEAQIKNKGKTGVNSKVNQVYNKYKKK